MSPQEDKSISLLRTERGGLVKASSALISRGLRDLANLSKWSVRQVWSGGGRASVSRFGQVAVWSSDVFGRVLIFDPGSRDSLKFTLEDNRLTPRTDVVVSISVLAWSPDGSMLVMAENSYAEGATEISRHQVVLFNVRTRDIHILRPASQYRWSYSPQWSGSGRYVAVGRCFDSGEPIILWSFDNNRAVDCWVADQSLCESIVWCAAFSPDERRLAALATAENSRSVLLILQVPSLKLIKRIELSFNPTSVNWQSDKKTLVLAGSLGSGATGSFDLDTEQLVILPFDSSEFTCCHPNKSIAAFANRERITIGDLSHGTILGDQALDADEIIHDMSWSADGTMVSAVSNLGRVYSHTLSSSVE